jgi:hypothetical protein
MKVKTIDEYYE